MIFGKKQPEMFEAFRQKSDKPEDAGKSKPETPDSKPADLRPPVPIPGMTKPPAKPFGGAASSRKPVVPELKEAKSLTPKPTTPEKAPEPKLFDDKPTTPEPKPANVGTPTPSPAAQTPKPAPQTPSGVPGGTGKAPAPGVTRPASSAPVSKPATPVSGALGGLKNSDDVHVMEFGKKSEVVLGLSYQALTWAIVMAFAAVVVVVVLAVTLTGHKTPAENSATSAGNTGGATTRGTVTPPPPENPTGDFPPGTYYSVQVLTVKNDAARMKELESVEAFLKEQRAGDVVRRVNRRGDLVSLFAGAFLREHKADAEVLAKRIQKMVFRGRYEFKDAQVVSTQ